MEEDAILFRTSELGQPARSGFGNSLSRPRPNASKMRFSSLSEYPFAFRPASFCKLYLLSARRYIRLTSLRLLRLSRLKHSNDTLAGFLQSVLKLHFCLLLGDT